MCGICGHISRAPIEDATSVERMLGALRHRGPDGEGRFREPHLAMSMCRLGIIDPVHGGQPLRSEDGSVVLIANGEIYNHVELRAELIARGHCFATGSDCETIVHLYEEHGADCVDHLRGMFAFALWDGRKRRLILARDRMGEKPLYLVERPGGIVFASELKSLLSGGCVPFELDESAVNLYFHYGYVPEPFTPVRGVRKLPAAHVLSIDVDSWRVDQRCYWRMADARAIEGDPATVIRAELETVAALTIRSDVPVGIALSGGLDSAAIAALVAERGGSDVRAFTVGYPDRPPYDERAMATQIADHVGIEIEEVELSTNEMVDSFETMVEQRDDPIADIAGYGYYAVAARARERGAVVLLQGQGGDELFWYPWTRDAAADLMGRRSAVDPSRNEAYLLYDHVPDFRWANRHIAQWYSPAFLDRIGEPAPADLCAIPSDDPRPDIAVTRMICDLYLRENGIAQGDRLSMASSVELRLPLVDHRLVETVIGLRKVHEDDRLPAKTWLKEAVRDLLPEWVIDRPKQGFSPPLRTWHRALFDAFGETLRDGYLAGHDVLRRDRLGELAAGPFPEGAVVPMSFKTLVLETWCRRMNERALAERSAGDEITNTDRAVCV